MKEKNGKNKETNENIKFKTNYKYMVVMSSCM